MLQNRSRLQRSFAPLGIIVGRDYCSHLQSLSARGAAEMLQSTEISARRLCINCEESLPKFEATFGTFGKNEGNTLGKRGERIV